MRSNNQFIFYVHVWIVHKKYNNFSFSVDAKIDSSLDRINLDFGPHIVHQGGLTWVLKENNEKLSGMQSLSLTQLFMGKSCRESLYWKKNSITIQKFFEFILKFEKCCNAWGIGKVLYYRLRTQVVYTYIFFSIQTTVQKYSDKTNYRYNFSKTSGIFPANGKFRLITIFCTSYILGPFFFITH